MPQLPIIASCRTFVAVSVLGFARAAFPAPMGDAPELRSLELGGFPEPFALASSWDPALARETYAAIAASLRASGARMVLGPSLAIARDPRRGRIEQSFGEDPYLVGEMGLAAIEGLQGAGKPHGLAPGKVLAAITDFAGPGLPNGGAGAAPVSERELRESYFPPFEQVLRRTAIGAIVPSRNDIDGIPSHANPWLLKEVLRGEWKFGGTVIAAHEGIADLHEVYRIAANANDATRIARAAGVDAGPMQLAAAAPAPDDSGSRPIALKAAQRSITLLKNDGTLPLALPAPGRARLQLAIIELGVRASIVAEVRARMRERADIVAAGRADRIVLAVGESDAAAQRESMSALVPLGKPVVVVLVADRPGIDGQVSQQASAVLGAWGLGSQGGKAIASVLFGDANPGGKLPVTIARNAGQLPLFYNAKPSSRRGYLFDTGEALYPFGWGLSYSSFELGPPLLSSSAMGAAGSIKVSVEIRNNSKRAGDETIQLYIRGKVSSTTRPVKELKGFQRVSLKPGEKRTVRFTLAAQDLATWNDAMRRVVEPGEYEVMTGPNSVALRPATLRIRAGAPR